MMLEQQQAAVSKRKLEALQNQRENTENAIHALVTLRKHFGADKEAKCLLDDWVAEDKRLRVQIHNYDEFLML
jgi:hypothetical protein